MSPRILLVCLVGLQLVVCACVLGILLWIGLEYKEWPNAGPEQNYRRIQTVICAFTTLSVAIAAIGAVGVLLATTAPRLLSQLHLGPLLALDWLRTDNDCDYYHPWDHDLVGRKGRGVFLRLRVKNDGYIGAEKVECTLERLRVDGYPVPYFLSDNLRWSHTWEFDSETLHGQRLINSTTWPLINPGTAHYVDFAFIFEPGSEFYKRLNDGPRGTTLRPNLSAPDFWCLHLCTRWLPSAYSAIVPDSESHEYEMCLRLSAQNSHTVEKILTMTVGPRQSLKNEHFDNDEGRVGRNKVVGRADAAVTLK